MVTSALCEYQCYWWALFKNLARKEISWYTKYWEKIIMIVCAPFIEMVWSHDKRQNNDRFFEGGLSSPKLFNILRRGLSSFQSKPVLHFPLLNSYFLLKIIPNFLLNLNILNSFLFWTQDYSWMTQGLIRRMIKAKFKSLIICYFIVETKQKHNRTINVTLDLFQTIQRKSPICFPFKNYSKKTEFKSSWSLSLALFLNSFKCQWIWYSYRLYSYKKVCMMYLSKKSFVVIGNKSLILEQYFFK